MKEIVVLETLVNIDKNWAGFVYREVYIIDIFPHEDKGSDPDWVLLELEQFYDS